MRIPVNPNHDKDHKNVEEAFLSLGFAAQELDIINQENISAPKLVVKVLGFLVLEGNYKLVSELLSIDIKYARATGLECVCNGMQQMCLAYSGVTVNKKRIVGTSRLFGDLQSGCISHAVRLPGDKGIKGVRCVNLGWCGQLL